MSLSSAKFAFQIDETQSFMHIDTSSEKVVGSKKSSVTLQDGSTKEMTIFFAADKNTVIDMQNKGLARSNQQTMNDFKRFLPQVKRHSNLLEHFVICHKGIFDLMY